MTAPKMLVTLGAVLVVLGLIWEGLSRLGWDRLGRLPGDLHIENERFLFHFPWVTCLILSLVLSAALRLWSKFC